MLYACTPTTKSGLQTGRTASLEESQDSTQWQDFCEQISIGKAGNIIKISGCFEGIGRFPGDPCKFHLKPDHQPARHASKKQGIPEEVNEHADGVHSNIFVEKALEREPYYTHSTGETTTEFPGRVEHARHFPTHMEMCMDDHSTQTTEGTQQQYLQDISHVEFPSGMENTPSFPEKQFLQGKEGFTLPDMEKMPVFLGNQFLQGKEKNMDTGTFTLGNIILNRYPALSTLTHQATEPGRVQQNFQQLKMESSNMVALPCFNFNAEATTQMETSKKRPGADSIHNGKDIPVTSSRVTPIGPKDSIQLPARTSTHTLMSIHSQDSHSSKTNQLKKSKVQGNRLTRFNHHFDTDSTCDQKSLPRDHHKYWNDRETLSINLKMDTNMNTNCMTTIPMAHKEVYFLPRPLKAMAHQYRHPEKEVHLLSGPSELQPVDDGVTQYTPKGKDQDLLQPQDASEVQKLRGPTQIQQPRQEYSRFTEKEKAKFQTPSTDNDDRNFVRHNSVEKFSPDLVHPTKSHTSSVSDSIFFRRKGGNHRRCTCTCRRCTCTCTHTGDSRGMTTLHSRIKKVNEKELWEASQCI